MAECTKINPIFYFIPIDVDKIKKPTLERRFQLNTLSPIKNKLELQNRACFEKQKHIFTFNDWSWDDILLALSPVNLAKIVIELVTVSARPKFRYKYF